MTLDTFSPLLDRYAACGRLLADTVATRDTDAIEQTARKLADMTLEFQAALPEAMALLARAPAPVRQAWRARIEDAAHAVKVGGTLADMGHGNAAARLAVLAQASGAGLSYAKNGQLGLGAR